MKGLAAIFLGTIMIFSVLPNYNAFSDKLDNPGKPEFVSIEKLKEPKSIKLADGRILEKKVFIFPDENKAKPNGVGPPEGKGDKTTSCFSFISKGAKWKSVENYIVDDDFGPSNTLTGIQTGISSWENAITPAVDVFGTGTIAQANVASIGNSMNGVNEVAFAQLSDPNTIAVTISWGIFSGSPSGRVLVEWDQIYNTDYNWGNAGPTNENGLGDTTIMDFENIAVHELGHAAGLSHPDNSCIEETMYAFATEGETKKRTLNTGDIAGINALY